MQTTDFKRRAILYKSYLLDNVMPFWMEHSIDEQYGGFFTCLDRTGRVYDKDKFIWLQCRQVWTLSMLYNNLESHCSWLDAAISGAGFLQRYGRNKDGDWYFSLDRKGRPLVAAYNIFSDCFATMGFAQLYKATGNDAYAEIAKQTFNNILARKDNPKGSFAKQVAGTRDLKGFSLPMILCNLVLEIEHLLSPDMVQQTLEFGVKEVMEVFYKEEHGLILENVGLQNEWIDCFEGRLINPGHGLEAMWFIMDIASKWNNKALVEKCINISLKILDFGWDPVHGGLFYFKDLRGYPPQQLEWDQKLWWVHLEAMINALKAYRLSGNQVCLDWYEKLHDYTWKHFVDKEHGEMFGYLNRQGDVLLNLKGGKWKGCFHVPRALYQLTQLSHEISSYTHSPSLTSN